MHPKEKKRSCKCVYIKCKIYKKCAKRRHKLLMVTLTDIYKEKYML